MRPNYAAGVFASVLLVPIMFLQGDSGGGDAALPEFDLSGSPAATWLEPTRVVAEDAPTPMPTTTLAKPATTVGRSPAQVAAPAPAPASASPSTTTSVPPTTSAPTTTTARATTTVPTATTTVRPATTTTVALPATLPPATVAPAQRPFGTHSARGVASWFNAPDGTCAHTTIPKGTVIRVTRLHNGAQTTCIVNDWGPADTSRIIDLSMDTFEKLAAPEAGLIDVLIEW